MCSVGDDIEEESDKLMSVSSLLKLLCKNCVKCKAKSPVVVLNKVYPYCQNCFLATVTHKFKVSLGKSKITHSNDKVLIKYETGHSSTALLHLLHAGMNLTTPKRILLQPHIIFIEKNFHLSVAERRTLLQKVSEDANSYDFPVYFFPFIEYLRHDDLNKYLTQDWESVVLSEKDGDDFVQNMKERKSLTTQNTFCDKLEHELLDEVANMLTCNNIFLPSIMINIATQFLTSISLGQRGTTDSGLDETSLVQIFRPLRCLTVKEVALYNIYNKLNPVTLIPEQENANSSVQSLMKKFVGDLQDNYPSTVSTIVRTSDKLSTPKDSPNANSTIQGSAKELVDDLQTPGVICSATDDSLSTSEDTSNANSTQGVMRNLVFDLRNTDTSGNVQVTIDLQTSKVISSSIATTDDELCTHEDHSNESSTAVDLENYYHASTSGDRISTNKDSLNEKCLNCQTSLRHQMTPAIQAVRFSHWISQLQKGDVAKDTHIIIEDSGLGSNYCLFCKRMACYVKNNQPKV